MRDSDYITNNKSSVTDISGVIKYAIGLKISCAPAAMNEVGFLAWKAENKEKYLLIKGYSSILDNIDSLDTFTSVVIKKYGSRDGNSYLVFRDTDQFLCFQKGALLLGTACYELHSVYIDNLLKKIADGYGLSAAEIDEGRDILERRIGLYLGSNINCSDEELSSDIMAFSKRILLNNVAQYMENVSGKYLYIDENNIDIIDQTQTFEINDSIRSDTEQKRLIGCIVDKIYELKSKNGGHWDMKDCLLPQIIAFKDATAAFLNAYYSHLNNRRTYWRPVAFGHQVLLSFKNGKEYLKNPVYINECAAYTVGIMLGDQAAFSKENPHINDIKNKLTDSGEFGLKLQSFAVNFEQLGKALSKEIVTKEAVIAIAAGIAETVLCGEQAQQ